MNTFIRIGLITFSLSMGVSAMAQEECLRRASNRDLLAELESRLGTGSGSGSVDSAIVNYLCEYDGDMTISLVNSVGAEEKVEVDIDNIQNCNEMARVLIDNRSRIHKTSIIGVCKYSGDMIRYTITPQGRITKISEVDIDSVPICMQQAAALNGGR